MHLTHRKHVHLRLAHARTGFHRGVGVITIADPPTVHACATCQAALSWLYSPKRGAWIAVVRVDDDTMRLHRCRHAQDPATWRELRRGDPPSPDYLAARQKIKPSTEELT